MNRTTTKYIRKHHMDNEKGFFPFNLDVEKGAKISKNTIWMPVHILLALCNFIDSINSNIQCMFLSGCCLHLNILCFLQFLHSKHFDKREQPRWWWWEKDDNIAWVYCPSAVNSLKLPPKKILMATQRCHKCSFLSFFIFNFVVFSFIVKFILDRGALRSDAHR